MNRPLYYPLLAKPLILHITLYCAGNLNIYMNYEYITSKLIKV